MSDDLALRTTVRELVAAFVSAERDVRAAFAQIVAAEAAVNAAFCNGDYAEIRVTACGTRFHDNFARPDETIAIMSRKAWRALVDRLELRRVMSIERWEKLNKHLESGELPHLTEENVLAFYGQHAAQAHEMLQEMVREVFDWLRPRPHTRAGKLKTNTEMEVGERVILDGVVERDTRSGFRVRYDSINWSVRQRLIALENVFNGLAGNGTVCKGYQSLLGEAIGASNTGVGETDLFAFRAHKNGRLHLKMRRPDLLKRFNQIAGGARLRPKASETETA